MWYNKHTLAVKQKSMIDFTRAEILHIALHFVGNKGLDEKLILSEDSLNFKDDFVKQTLLRYFFSPFKNDVFFRFKNKSELRKNNVEDVCKQLFSNQKGFLEHSIRLAEHLYNQSIHPKIKSGEFYACYIKDVKCQGELCDAIGLFKTENKETFIKVFPEKGGFGVDCEEGININKLDKGALIFNTEKNNGYKISLVDNNNKNAECALYWEEDFMGATLKENAYYFTKNFIDTTRGFCEEMLTEQNNVSKENQRMMLNKSTGYLKEKDNFNIREFERDVLVEPELISAFSEYRHQFNEKFDLQSIDEFEVSPTAVKKNQKYMRSVVKLDKNFHLYIHGRHDYVEKGYDEKKGLKYYKLYFVNEQ